MVKLANHILDYWCDIDFHAEFTVVVYFKINANRVSVKIDAQKEESIFSIINIHSFFKIGLIISPPSEAKMKGMIGSLCFHWGASEERKIKSNQYQWHHLLFPQT